MNKIYFAAAAALLFAGCADDKFTGEGADGLNGTGAIAFNMQGVGQTRVDGASTSGQKTGAAAAGLLNNMFIVWGEKNEVTTGEANAATEETNTVFKNYVVKYTTSSSSSSSNTSTTNTSGWEYVGYTPYANSIVAPSLITNDNSSTFKQTVKYWDDQANSYTFTAVSAKDDDLQPTSGNPKVKITKNIGSTEQNATVIKAADKGYTIELGQGASVDDIYFADRNYIAKSNGYNHSAVTMSFRSLMSKIRFGVYETVPGYKVVITGIKYGSGDSEVTHPKKDNNETDNTFGVNGNFIVAGTNTKYTVTYDANNKSTVALVSETDKTPASTTTLNTKGTDWLSTTSAAPVGTTADQPTYDKSETNGGNTTKGIYTTILPNPSNKTGLTLQVAYKLISEDTGEERVFKNGESEQFREVTVPAEFCQWKSNYAYTYLFTITDKSADLYPITFDAVVETDEIGNLETITTVEKPSITTLGVKDSKIVTGKNEYETGSTIYAVVSDPSTSQDYATLSNENSSANIKLYTVTAAEGFDITEAAVAQAVSSTATGTKKLTVTEVQATGESGTTNWEIATSVPAEDGSTCNISALKWTPTAAAVYAVEYTKTITTNGESDTKKYYKIVKVVAAQTE